MQVPSITSSVAFAVCDAHLLLAKQKLTLSFGDLTHSYTATMRKVQNRRGGGERPFCQSTTRPVGRSNLEFRTTGGSRLAPVGSEYEISRAAV